MEPDQQILLISIASWAAAALGLLIALLLTYVVIRQGVFHGLRAHTRWIDEGKR
ncbi:hypothetical protein JOE59_003471 [Agromyces cerinus]|uniref:hypothetical protein n=1 Tax=Agromyces cerinus TaxID=33878 RepID=UPI00195D08AE|nr:hypothetical protein [Agromyces cerinus]MBM7832766.1 hypothetical protein [Agromyces cerinus]